MPVVSVGVGDHRLLALEIRAARDDEGTCHGLSGRRVGHDADEGAGRLCGRDACEQQRERRGPQEAQQLLPHDFLQGESTSRSQTAITRCEGLHGMIDRRVNWSALLGSHCGECQAIGRLLEVRVVCPARGESGRRHSSFWISEWASLWERPVGAALVKIPRLISRDAFGGPPSTPDRAAPERARPGPVGAVPVSRARRASQPRQSTAVDLLAPRPEPNDY